MPEMQGIARNSRNKTVPAIEPENSSAEAKQISATTTRTAQSQFRDRYKIHPALFGVRRHSRLHDSSTA